MARRFGVALTAATVVVLSACGGPPPADPAGAAVDGFPMTVENCGRQVTLNSPPERILAIGGEVATVVWAAGGTERISTVAPIEGEPLGAATDDLAERAQLVIPSSADGELSLESIIEQAPDLVVAFDLLATSPEALDAAGITTLLASSRCGSEPFDGVFDDIETFSRILGTQEQAAGTIASLRTQVEQARQLALPAAEGRRVAATFVSGGPETTLMAYGSRSMVDRQMEILGLQNVFGDTDQRIFEASTEAIIAAAPEIIIAPYSGGLTDEEVRQSVLDRPELASVPAVANGFVIPLNFFYTSNGLLAVDGLAVLADRLAAVQ